MDKGTQSSCPPRGVSQRSLSTFLLESTLFHPDFGQYVVSGDVGLIPGSGRPPGEGNGNPLQCSCLENPMDRGAWRAAVHGVAESRSRLKE